MTSRLLTRRPRALRCDRCAAAGNRRYFVRLIAPYWDPTYRFCPACAHAVAELLDATNAWPHLEDGSMRFPALAGTTGAPHYLNLRHQHPEVAA